MPSQPPPSYTSLYPLHRQTIRFDAADPRNKSLPEDYRNDPTPEQIHARLRRSRLVPVAEWVPCPTHDAATGEPCWPIPHAVCGPRITRGQAAQAAHNTRSTR